MAFWTGLQREPAVTGSDLIEFPKDLGATGEWQCQLRTEISILDTRSSYMFGPGSRARAQVKALLQGAVDGDLKCNERRFITLASQAFHDRILSRSRALYVGGVLLGVVVLVTAARFTPFLSDPALRGLGMPSPACCAWTILFAGMGTMCSVFSRLASIDMCNETSPLFLGLSGFFRPVTATLFALAIIQILKLDIVTIRLPAPQSGQTEASSLEHFYFLSAFLAGFSERFASDLIGRAERVIATAYGPPQRSTSPSVAEPHPDAQPLASSSHRQIDLAGPSSQVNGATPGR
jgi:hypothetical protein